MIIKIEGGSLGAYTGLLSGVMFKDGVSEREVTFQEARRIGVNVRIIDVATGRQAGLLDAVGNIPAAPLVEADSTPEPEVVVEKKEEVEETLPEDTRKRYTKEELEVIADKEGIKGIRAIASEWEVKGVQIAQLIGGILAAQGKTR